MIGAEVYLWGTKIGTVIQESVSDIPKFSYDKNFINSGIELSPIVMPLSNRVYSFPILSKQTFYNLPGLLADSLPDKFGTKLIERYLNDSGRNIEDFCAVERLLYVGSRAMGALEYRPAMDVIKTKSSSINLDSLVELASEILSNKEKVHFREKNPTMEQIIKVGTSAGGARAKAIIAWNRKTNDIKSGQINNNNDYEYYIIKFDGVKNNQDNSNDCAFTRIEYAYYLMALDAKINMSHCELLKENNRYHFMTKRFDRISNQKLHMQTLGALAHYDFNNPGVNSYEQASKIMYKLNLNQVEIEQFFRRMVFNVIARNQDDHVKNISFLMNKKGVWSLSPAYDVTYAYNPNNFWLKNHQMSINSKLNNFKKEDIIACAQFMNISKAKIEKIITDVQNSILKWEEFAQIAFVPEEEMLEIKKNFILF